MTGILHILRPLLLALLLAVTGQAVAMARGAPPAARAESPGMPPKADLVRRSSSGG